MLIFLALLATQLADIATTYVALTLYPHILGEANPVISPLTTSGQWLTLILLKSLAALFGAILLWIMGRLDKRATKLAFPLVFLFTLAPTVNNLYWLWVLT